MGLRAPGAGDTEPGAAGPGAGEARGLAASAQSMVGGGGPWESFFAARRVRALRTQTRLGLGGLRSGLRAGEGARGLEEVCVCARIPAGRSPLRAACVAAAALVAGFGEEGEGAGGAEGEGSREVGKSWLARGSALTARAEESGVRSGLGEMRGEGRPPAPSPPGAAPGRAGRRPRRS